MVLKSRIFPFNPFGFPFNPFGLARALKTGLIGGARARRNTKFNFEANYLCCVRKCKHKFHGLVGPQTNVNTNYSSY